MKNSILVFALLVSSFVYSQNEHGAKQAKTLFGNSYNIDNLVKLEYNKVFFYVVKDSPIHKIYKEDHFKYEVFMAIEFERYAVNKKITLASK